MGHPAIDDVRGVHAVLHRFQGAADLRQHAAVDGAVLDQRVDPVRREAGEHAAFLVLEAGHVGEQDQLLGAQHFRHLARHQVGVDVVAGAVLVDADRRDHRNEVAAAEQVEHLGVDALHLAHMADVDDFRSLQLRVVGVQVLEQHLARLDQAAVLAGQAHRLAAVVLDQVDDVLVDQAAEHHLHHVHGFPVGDAHALDELALLAEPVEQIADLWAAAVDDHRIDADLLHHHHVAGEAVLQLVVFHGVAAVFDHHGGAGEALNIRQRFNQNAGGFLGALGVHVCFLQPVKKYPCKGRTPRRCCPPAGRVPPKVGRRRRGHR